MKKILFLLLCTVSIYGQTYPTNPTAFGKISINTNIEDNAITKMSVQSSDNRINWLQPINIPIPISPTNYIPTALTIGGHLTGIDNKLGTIVATTAGITTRVWFTADQTTITAGTFDLTNPTGKGATASHVQSVTNDDNQKKYFTTDLIGNAFASDAQFPPGIYAGNLSASTTPNSAQQRWTVELYKCDNNGTPIASGVTGAPVGHLGVTVIVILDSGLLTLADGSVTNVQVSGNVGGTGLAMLAGQRIRYHVSAEKVGTAASNITESVYYGSSFNSFLDVPVTFDTNSVLNKSTVVGATTTEALNALNSGKADDSNVLHKTGNESFTGLKSATNSASPASNGIIITNNNNSGLFTSSNSAPFQIINNLSSLGGHILNSGSGIGLYGQNASSGIGDFWDNTGITGVLHSWNSKTGSTGDLLQFSKNNVLTGKIDHNGAITAPLLNITAETSSTIASFDASKNVKSLSTATYPNLTELAYVKGVTSDIQTQLNGKQSTLTNPVIGTGTTNFVPKFTASSTIGNSRISDDGTDILLNGNSKITRLLSLNSSTYLDGGGAASWVTGNGTSTYGGGFVSALSGVAKSYFYYSSGYTLITGESGVGIKMQANGVDAFILETTGVAKIPNLAGTGTRQVVADASGNLSANNVKITITTSVSITTATLDVNSVGQDGHHVVIDNGVNAINLTCNGGVTTSYGKVGTGAITFVQGSGRTLVQLSGTAILSGIAGSTATLWSNGTTDYLSINNY